MTEEAKPIVHNVVPFGKYRGQPIEVLRQDQDYLNWLAAQDWFRKQYAALYAMLVAEPTETPPIEQRDVFAGLRLGRVRSFDSPPNLLFVRALRRL